MSGKQAPRHVQSRGRPRRRLRGALAGAILIAVAVPFALNLAVGWSIESLWNDSDTTTEADRASSSGEASPTPKRDPLPARQQAHSSTSPGSAELTSLRACAARLSNGERVVAAAGEGIGHWRQHIQARTDMLKGRISQKKMDAIWERTQRAGPADERRFRATARRLPSRSHCGQPRTYAPRDRGLAHRCSVRAAVTTRALRAAHAAMRDWRVHRANMIKFSRGRMSASMAQGKWVQAWRNAPINITAYRTARAQLDRAPTCHPR
jgi:hypothetical protein